MAKKRILTIEFELCSDEVEYCSFDSNTSLLDWDIIAFKPDIKELMNYRDTYLGKPSLSDDNSFRLKEKVEHWRREIKDAAENGKTVIVFLSDLEELYIATGEKQYSGTGRNQKTTRIVTTYSNYNAIPVNISPTKTEGESIKLTNRNSELISSYWSEFSSYSKYKVILDGVNSPCLLTKHGDKVVGAIYNSKNSQGALILLPDIDFYPESFFDEDGEWSLEAEKFASKFIKSIVSLDKTLKSIGERTPEPEWAKSEEYLLKSEQALSFKLLKIETQLEKIQIEKETLVDKIKDSGRLRNLLFEKGKPLEYSIIDALRILGFSISQFDDGKSEFDAVFESKEGRLIGEVEGRDSKAINISKLRQLSLNIHEDLEREEIDVPAKSVLFGNAYRLQPIHERSEPFTDKCISSAKVSSTALVFTPDLFLVAKYLSDKKDSRFATRCRKIILNTTGRVEFPKIPILVEEKLIIESN